MSFSVALSFSRVNPRISPLGAYLFFEFLHWGLFKGGFIQGGVYSKGGLFKGDLKSLLVVGHIPVEIFLLITYFFDATHTRNRMLHKGRATFR